MSYTSEVLADSPAIYLRLGEPSGTTANDSSAAGTNDGTYVNTPTLGAAGAVGTDTTNTAVTFNGTDERVTVADHASLDVGDVFTIEFWTKNPANARRVCTRGSLAFQVATGGFGGLSSGVIALEKTDVAGFVAHSSAAVNDGAWHHVAITKNGSTRNIYVDGVDVTVLDTNQTMASTATSLFIGSAVSTHYYQGTLDEFALYPTALSAARVLAHYQAGYAVRGHVDLPVSASVDAAGNTVAYGAATLTVPVSLTVPGGVVPVSLDPVDPGVLTLDGVGPNPPVGYQAGNLLPYQVGVDFLGSRVVEPAEPGTYIPILTPSDPGVLTGDPH